MPMNSKRCHFLLFAVLVSCTLLASAEVKRSHSDQDLRAVGHRKIASHDRNLYSPQAEQEVGKQEAIAIEKNEKLLSDSVVDDGIAKLLALISQHSDAHPPISLKVIDSEESYSVSLPGGYEYVSRGLLMRLEDESQLASFLAREIAHQSLHSAARQRSREQLAQMASIPMIFIGQNTNATNVAVPLTLLNWKRQDELDADYFGIQYLYLAGYDPRSFVEMVNRIWQNRGQDSQPQAFERWPPLDQRTIALNDELAAFPTRPAEHVTAPICDFNQLHAHLQRVGSISDK